MSTKFFSPNKPVCRLIQLSLSLLILTFCLFITAPSVLASPPAAPQSAGLAQEIEIFDLDRVVTESDRGFPRKQPPLHNTNWVTPTNYADGTLHFRAEVRSQPVAQDMLLQFCFWQTNVQGNDNFANEACARKESIVGNPGTFVTWSQDVEDMWNLPGGPIDWTRARYRTAAVIKRPTRPGDSSAPWGIDPPVSDYDPYDWAGEDPADWYPLDMRFTVVLVAPGSTFSGWETYVGPVVDNNAPILTSHTPVDGATNAAQNTNIVLNITDNYSGLDLNTFKMTLDTASAMTVTIPYTDTYLSNSGSAQNKTFTYNPPADFSLGEQVTVTVDVSDVDGNAMPTETFNFTVTSVLDVTPPVISNVQCFPGSQNFTVVWDTDEPASSLVEYGPTAALGSSVSGTNLVTSHSLQVTGLTMQTDYHYQVTTTDAGGNSISQPISGTLVCTTAGPSSVQSDDFNQCALDTNLWNYIDPLGQATMTATNTQIQFDIPANQNYDVWTSGNNSARIMQPANDTVFEIDVKFETGITESKQIQGVIIEQDSDTYLRIGFGLDNSSKIRIYAYSIDGNSTSEKLSGNGRPLNSSIGLGDPLYLRVWRQSSSEWTVFYSGDGITWLQPGGYDFSQTLGVSSMGVFAGNAYGANPFTSVVDYFFRTDLPIYPEDGTAMSFGSSVSPVGVGSISTSASCGNPIEVTAEPIPGWAFDSWTSLQGSLITTTNPVSFSFPKDEVITANFVQNFYEIEATVNDGEDGQTGGTIALGSPAATQGYEYNQLVEVSASPSTGWIFDGWSGDVTSTALDLTLTMTDDYSLSANFSPISYTVDVAVTGAGSVEALPSSDVYYYSDVVSMTAVADAGWTFDSWGGDLNGALPTGNLTIDDNKSVTALFTQDQYTLTVETAGSGNGTVDLAQPTGTYVYGDLVTMTASSDLGSTFIGWSGAGLSGSSETVVLTMEQSESVVAEFEANYYMIVVGALQGGTVSVSSPANENGYVYGELVTVSAVSDEEYLFENWTGSLTGNTNPIAFNITETLAIGALFKLIPPEVTTYVLNVSSSDGGTVAPLGGTYLEGTSVALFATADEDYVFVNWTDASGAEIDTSNPLSITMTSDMTVTANFEATSPGEFSLERNKNGNGSITSNPTGGSFAPGTEVTLTAEPDLGWSFTGWSGDVDGSDASVTITMAEDATVTATFTQNRYTLSTSVVGNGLANVTAPADAFGYTYGEMVTLTTTADDGWAFAGWDLGDGRTTTDNPATLSVEESLTLTATFIEESASVVGTSLAAQGQGQLQISPEKAVYAMGEEITLTAVAEDGWTFVRWDSTEPFTSGSASEMTITVKAADNMNVRAIFEPTLYPLYLPLINP